MTEEFVRRCPWCDFPLPPDDKEVPGLVYCDWCGRAPDYDH